MRSTLPVTGLSRNSAWTPGLRPELGLEAYATTAFPRVALASLAGFKALCERIPKPASTP